MIDANIFSPAHPARFFLSSRTRRISRSLQDLLSPSEFASKTEAETLPHLAIEHQSPIFRELKGVARELQSNKRKNLQLCVPSIDGLVVEPGQVFSFWKLIGEPSAERGFLPGLVIRSGRAAVDVGGGICQLSNALFWCVLHTSLSVVERHRHSFDLFPDDRRTVPFGLGATVAYGLKDLRFSNHTDTRYQIRALVSEDELYVAIHTSFPEIKFTVKERDAKFYQKADKTFRTNNVVRTNLATGESTLLYANDFECRY